MRIPYSTEQGIILPEQGLLAKEQGILSADVEITAGGIFWTTDVWVMSAVIQLQTLIAGKGMSALCQQAISHDYFKRERPPTKAA
jgi:hypothetical protein